MFDLVSAEIMSMGDCRSPRWHTSPKHIGCDDMVNNLQKYKITLQCCGDDDKHIHCSASLFQLLPRAPILCFYYLLYRP